MAANIYDLSVTAASNTTIDGIDISGSTGKVKDGDNVMRSEAAFMAQFIDDQGGIATTAGSANAQTVTLASGFTANANGHVFTVKIGAGLANTTTTPTLNVNGIGAIAWKVDYGGVIANPLPGDLQGGSYATFLDNGTNFILLNPQAQGRYPPGTLYGLTLSNGTDATNDINVAVGSARDGADSANMDLLTALGKQLDVSWAVGGTTGSPLGMLATGGAVGNNRYFLFLIKRPDTGVVDLAADTSSTGANIAANTNAAYTILRAVGEVTRTGGVNGVPIWYGTTPISGTWTPTDASGAGLSFSSVSGTYIKIGKLVKATLRLTFPATASGAVVTIGGLPFTSATYSGGAAVGAGSIWAFGIAAPNGAGVATLNSAALTFTVVNGAGVNSTNANWSTAVVSGTLTYEATA